MVSPFANPAFAEWLQTVPSGAVFLEPFAGANNLVRMVDELVPGREWRCFDLEPQHPDVVQRDTIADFPAVDGAVAVVTNPPYLAKNVARRQGMHEVADMCGRYDNLYKLCLDRCLAGAGWVAAIIPESFLTAGVFRDRLQAVVSLDRPMFVDTEVPVCLALWGPAHAGDFMVWKGAELLGTWAELTAAVPTVEEHRSAAAAVRFNDVGGLLGLLAVDSPKGATIRFCRAEEIAPEEVKHSSRHRTRIAVDGLDHDDVDALIAAANARLAEARDATRDVVLTSFMGMRRDGWYRRRLDFALARALLAAALDDTRSAGPPPAGDDQLALL